MKKIKVGFCMICIFFAFQSNVFGISNAKINKDINVDQKISMDESLVTQIEQFMEFDSLNNIDFTELMINPLELFWVFIKAILIVIAINMLAKVICKVFFNYSDIVKRRIKTRKLTKILNNLYE